MLRLDLPQGFTRRLEARGKRQKPWGATVGWQNESLPCAAVAEGASTWLPGQPLGARGCWG